MMCSTASVQVCVDAGGEEPGWSGFRWRWHLLHAIGPVLVAAFANSPLRGGRPTGFVAAGPCTLGKPKCCTARRRGAISDAISASPNSRSNPNTFR